jgi:glycosyltransferase involved in cell wall biosynthesis
MKIANIILTSLNGGAEQVFIDYMQIFKELNHQNFAIVKDDAPYANNAKQYCQKILLIKNKFGYYDFFAINHLKKFLQEHEIDYVFAHGGRAMFIASKAIAKIKNRKVLLIAINHSNNVKRSIGADLIISINKKIFYKTIDLGQNPQQSFIVHNALDLSNHQESLTKILLSSKPVITIGVIGRLHNIKAFDRAISLINYIKKNLKTGIFGEEFCRKKIILKIAGIGEEEKNLRNLVKELSLEEDVEFLGWIDKEDFFKQIDIFLLTSKIETFGLVILEAMKFKKPIISTDTDGCNEIIRKNIDGLIVENNSSESIERQFALAIQKISSNDLLVNEMINNAYQRLVNKFSFNNLKNVLREIVGKK